MNAEVAGKKEKPWEVEVEEEEEEGEGCPGSNITIIPRRIHSEESVKLLQTSAAL